MNSDAYPACPVPGSSDGSRITLAHGEGGRLMRSMLRDGILPIFGIDAGRAGDATAVPIQGGRIAFATDGYVVSPLFFPGGDIGKLAVFGTVNDLAVSGATPRWLSLGLVIEEGLPWETLEAVLRSAAASADEAGVRIVTGDTKVVPRGTVDALFITTSGIGEPVEPEPVGPTGLRPGDELLVTNSIARHGIAVMAARDGLAIEPRPSSDCASLVPAIEALRGAGLPPRAMRDATRGGVAAVLHEWAAESRLTMSIDETLVPVDPTVAAVCELLGLDPLHVANEGTMVVAVSAGDVEPALAALRTTDVARGATRIGRVIGRQSAPVIVTRGLGRPLPLDEPLGAPMPRIC